MADVAAKRKALETLPDDALVPVSWVRELVDSREPFEGIGTAEAAELLDMDPRKLRRMHRRWERQLDRGERPRVRVSRKNPANVRSDLLFDRGDVLRLAEATHRHDAVRLLEAVE